MSRSHSAIDRCLIQLDCALRTACAPSPGSSRLYPGESEDEVELSESERGQSAGLMRVNHAGEVSAQALYQGQAAVASRAETRTHLEQAANDESDHLAWCARRLQELDSGPSLADPVWYVGSFALGALAGLAGDRWSLGFVVETERQVEAHLGNHLNRLPLRDARSRAVVTQMRADEARHGDDARNAGGKQLPWPIPHLMHCCAGVMKFVAYRV